MKPKDRSEYEVAKARGDILRSERELHRMTQREAADFFNVTERTYCGWENGYKNLQEWELTGLIETMRRKVN